MPKSIEIVNALVKSGVAEKVFGDVIVFKSRVNHEKLAQIEQSYAEGFQLRLKERRDKERKAEIKQRYFKWTS